MKVEHLIALFILTVGALWIIALTWGVPWLINWVRRNGR